MHTVLHAVVDQNAGQVAPVAGTLNADGTATLAVSGSSKVVALKSSPALPGLAPVQIAEAYPPGQYVRVVNKSSDSDIFVSIGYDATEYDEVIKPGTDWAPPHKLVDYVSIMCATSEVPVTVYLLRDA